jgi:hypothetical protein
MPQIAILLYFLAILPGPHLYSRQEGQVPFANAWDFCTVGSQRPEW